MCWAEAPCWPICADVAPQLILILTGLATVSAVAKASKLHLLLRNLGQRPVFSHTLAISLVTDFAFLSSPAGAAGYVVNTALLRTAGASWVDAAAVVGAEQALDLFFFAVAIPIAAVSGLGQLAQIVPKISGSVYAALLAVVLLGTGGLWYGRRRMVTALHASLCALPWLQAKEERIGEFFSELRAQLGTLFRGDASRNLILLALTTVQWLSRYGVLWAVLLEFGYRLPFGFVLALQAVSLHLAQWTGIPAGGGSADMALAAALATWVSQPIMATVLILWRFATLYFPMLIGAFALVALSSNRSVKKQS